MPTYCFRCDACEARFQQTMKMSEASGQAHCECGGTADRDWESESPVLDIRPSDNQYPYVSNRLPRNLDGCKTDTAGKPVIMSKKHEREVMARGGYSRE